MLNHKYSLGVGAALIVLCFVSILVFSSKGNEKQNQKQSQKDVKTVVADTAVDVVDQCSFFDGKILEFGNYTVENGLIFYNYQVHQATYNALVPKKRAVLASGKMVNLNSVRDSSGLCLTERNVTLISNNVVRLSGLSSISDTYILAGHLYPVDMSYSFKPTEMDIENTEDVISFKVSKVGNLLINIQTGNIVDWYIDNPDEVLSPNLQLKDGSLYYKNYSTGKFEIIKSGVVSGEIKKIKFGPRDIDIMAGYYGSVFVGEDDNLYITTDKKDVVRDESASFYFIGNTYSTKLIESNVDERDFEEFDVNIRN